MSDGGIGQHEDDGQAIAAQAILEEARREADLCRRRLEEVQALTNVGSWEWELSEERASWSPELLRIAGFEPDDSPPTFDEFVEAVHPDDRAGYLADLQSGLKAGGVRHYRYRAVLPDGTVKVIESHARVEVDDSGTPVRVFGAAQDITDRQQIKTSLQLQSDLLDQVGVAVMASDLDRKLTVWNRGAEELFGISRAEAFGSTIDQVLRIPDTSMEQRMDMVTKLAAGERWEGELTVLGAGDRSFPAYATNAPVRDCDGEIVGYSGVLMDLSEMKEARAELQRRAEQQTAIAALSRTAMDESFDALAEQAVRTVIEILDVEFAEVLELMTDGQALRMRAGHGHEESLAGDMSPDLLPQAAYALEAKTVVIDDYTREERFALYPGLRERGALSGALIGISGGDHTYGVLGAHAVSVSRFSEESLEFLQAVANVLAAAIARQRAQRLEAQMHQSQRLEAVGQLAGGVAHDFNNMLAVIISYAGLVLDETDDQGTREDVREIKTAAERAANLTHQLLVFSRREVVVPEVVDLSAVVVETEGLLRHSLHEHIELVHSFGPGLWRVRLGSGQAEQILVNLLVNARNAMPDGGTVNIKTENLELEKDHGKKESLADGRYVRLTVADTGIGMSEEVKAQVFDPFFTTRKDDGGTGLGLATVYGIVKEAGGHIDVYSEPGRGTAIKVYLPAVFDEVGTEVQDRRRPIPDGEHTILLVEDEDSVRRIAERILAKSGYRVLAAADGQGALELAERHEGTIDLLLTDVVMPRMSGPQLATDLKALRPELQVLFMSGYTGEVISRHDVVDEGVALIEKPFDANGLLHAVDEALR